MRFGFSSLSEQFIELKITKLATFRTSYILCPFSKLTITILCTESMQFFSLKWFDSFAKKLKLFMQISHIKLRMILNDKNLWRYEGSYVKKYPTLIFFCENTNMNTIAENCAHLLRIICSFT